MTSCVVYQIRIRGHLDPQWSEWYDRLTMTHEADGTTLLAGPVRDQAELHGLLAKVRDLNLTLISLSQAESPQALPNESNRPSPNG